jgi:hypothetical protein
MTNIDRPDIVNVLKAFGSEISREYKPYIQDLVSETSSDGQLHGCSLYIIVPEIAYEYKVVDIEIKNVALCQVRFITLATGQAEKYNVPIDNGTAALIGCLNLIRSLGLFKLAIESLVQRVDLKRSFRSEVSKRIVPGEARVAVLTNGQQISAGWISIDNNEVTFYTAKALRELFRPGMTEEEQIIANEIKGRPLEQLKEQGYVDVRRMSDFREIL